MGETIDFLSGTDICRGLNSAEVAKIASILRAVHYGSGEVIIAEDSRGRDLYIVRSGRVLVSLAPPPSRYDAGTISKCVPGQIFGELGFLDGIRRSAWVVAIDEVEAFCLSWDDFQRLTQSNVKIAYQVIYNLALVIAGRLRDTTMLCGNLLGIRGRDAQC